eukprot:CAMPEP_0171004218 /NCGR_PEP_ID=MMETSP0736-20130129/17478_1 /TAXON_ID=186038 /ORGANISM="Fragilariopsis kerguelensis, Strain L26-C5" /LENGTH=42 /DNA_ID= /DNA_START= /DNA_END= /DNA_ORIENTATION=
MDGRLRQRLRLRDDDDDDAVPPSPLPIIGGMDYGDLSCCSRY